MPRSTKAGSKPRPHNQEVENENLRPPKEQGKPPRPATEPLDAPEGPLPDEVLNDPGSGRPVR